MKFPVWRYLNQSLFDSQHPCVLNPQQYWQLYCTGYLERCFECDWIEQCWNLDYDQFTERYRSFVERQYFEESNPAFLEHCWSLKYWRYGTQFHPEEFIPEN